MLSPFPGMDPFLDDPVEWSSVHLWLIVSLSDQLADSVSPDFVVKIEQRVYYDLEIRDRYIEIRDSRNREVVTTIELLSPLNKATGAVGYEAFQSKRRQVFNSRTHWIEIDLLRAGERPREVAGKIDYYAMLKRAGEYRFEVWYFDLRDRMPTIAVPLRPPFEDVPLDLQAAFNDTYRRAHYAESIDYSGNVPPPPLRPADVAWVQAQVEEWQVKKAAR